MPGKRDEGAYLGSTYLFEVIRQRIERHPGPVLDFALGRRREAAPEWLDALVAEQAALTLRRRLPDELERCVAAASSMLERIYGVRVAPESILPAPSGRAAMSALVSALIAPGDGVLVTEPSYPAFARLAAQRSARLAVATLDPGRDFAPDLSVMQDVDAAPRCAALNYPNNPTGAVIAPEVVTDLRGSLGPEGLLFNDAVYGPLTYEAPPLSLLYGEYAGGDGAPVIELHSLGKLFSLGPLGLAFLAGDGERIAAIRQYSDYAWTQISSLQLSVATRCLEGWQHVEGVRDGMRRRLAALRQVVEALGFEPYPTPAGMYLLCRRPGSVGGRSVSDAAGAAALLLDEYGLAVAPFEQPPHGYLRFSSAYRPEDLEALEALGGGSALASS
jgi:aspartate/methionine/tyrosine aminotransferase